MPAVDLMAAGTWLLEFDPKPRYGSVSMAAAATVALVQEPLKLIERPRLTKLLDEATSRILMLIAPAGYGKTTLTRQWMASRTHIWYRGTPAAADVAALAIALSEVSQPLFPGAGERMLHRLRATGTPEQDVVPLAELLAEDLATWPDDAWLVIDDYQFAFESAASERFVDLLVGLSPIQLFLASRVRPSWATARRLLYGEIYELGRSHLAMSQEEASLVLAHLDGHEASGILALADGWPAVIGLAALAQRLDLPENSIPDSLHEYFADELYRTAEPEVRAGLSTLAIIPTITAEIAELALGPMAEHTLAEGVRLGFLTSPTPGIFELHPLLRTFLTAKLEEERAVVSEELVSKLVRYLIERESWDDAFSLIERFFSESLFVMLLEIALSSLLTDVRMPTLARWLKRAERGRMDAPIIALADAEVALRDGSYSRAEGLALEAARRFGDDNHLTSHALCLAGIAAHFLDKNAQALEHHSGAGRLARDPRSRREALHGLLHAAAKLELERTDEMLAALLDLDDGTPESQLRLAVAQFNVRSRLENLAGLREALESKRHLLRRVRDPLVRTAFRHSYAQTLIDEGQYSAALRETSKNLKEAADERIAFVIPYGQLLSAVCHAGLRNFARAIHILDHLESRALETSNEYLRVETVNRRCKVLINQGLAEQALEECELTTLPTVLGERGEYLATRSLGLACLGQTQQALELSAKALVTTKSPHVRALAPWAEPIAALQHGIVPERAAEEAFGTIVEIGDLDSFVCVYRAEPRLLEILSQRGQWRGLLIEVLERARDEGLAARFSLLSPRSRRRRMASPLTRREQEVCGLLAQGLSNKEIATALFITESTAKAHVSHILEKLGVRSRAAAAVRAMSQEVLL